MICRSSIGPSQLWAHYTEAIPCGKLSAKTQSGQLGSVARDDGDPDQYASHRVMLTYSGSIDLQSHEISSANQNSSYHIVLQAMADGAISSKFRGCATPRLRLLPE